MKGEILQPTINVNNHTIKNEQYRTWMTNDSDLSKAIYHLSKAVDYLLVWSDFEEKIGKSNELSKFIECSCNQVSYLNDELIKFIDKNLDIIKIEKELHSNEKR